MYNKDIYSITQEELSMRCGNCGTKNEKNVAACSNCGKEMPVKKSGRRFSLIAVACTLIAALLICALAFVIRTPRSTVNKFFKAYVQLDGEAIMKLVPEEVRVTLLGPEGAQDEAIAALNQRLSDSMNALGGEGYSYSFKATHVKAIEGDDLAYIQQYYADTFGRKVTAAKTVEVRLTADNGVDTKYETVTVKVLKIGMRWYLDIGTFSIFTGNF